MTIQTLDNKFAVAQWIVDPVAGLGTHTTIAGAITAASSGDTIFIRPATYTENITLKDGVALTAFTPDGFQGNVTIKGKVSFSAGGTVNIAGIKFETNSDFAIEISGSNCAISLIDCTIFGVDNTAVSVTGTTQRLGLNNCAIIVTDASSTALVANCTGEINSNNTQYGNSISSVVPMTFQGCSFNSTNDAFSFALQFSASAIFRPTRCNFDTATISLPCFTMDSTGLTFFSEWCRFVSGTSPSITITAGTLQLSYAFIQSTAANVITGAGTLRYGPLTFNGNTGISAPNSPLAILPAPGSWVFIAEQTASASASITFTSGITTAYRNYALVLSTVVPVTNGVSLRLRVSTTGGGPYLAAGYNMNAVLNSGGGVASSTSTSEFLLTRSAANLLNNTAGSGLSGVIYLHDLTTGGTPKISGTVSYLETSAATWVNLAPCGRAPASITVDALEFTMSSGNISTGNFKLYGIL